MRKGGISSADVVKDIYLILLCIPISKPSMKADSHKALSKQAPIS
jgi:hypothetical protein